MQRSKKVKEDEPVKDLWDKFVGFGSMSDCCACWNLQRAEHPVVGTAEEGSGHIIY